MSVTSGIIVYFTSLTGSNRRQQPPRETLTRKKEKQFNMFLKYNLFLRVRAPYVDQKKPHLSG